MGYDFRTLFLFILPAVLLSLTFHEFSHGYVSYLLGDPTPKVQGRISLNPLRHLDLVGSLCLVLTGFGWAKPVVVDARYYQRPKQGVVLTALAGPLSNLLLAFLCIVGRAAILRFTMGYSGDFLLYLYYLLFYTSTISLGLGVFNLIPIPPLDGSKILWAVLPENLYFDYMRFERLGTILLFVLLAVGLLNAPLIVVRDFLENGMWATAKLLFGM